MRLEGYYFGFDATTEEHIVHVQAWESPPPGSRSDTRGRKVPREVRIPHIVSNSQHRSGDFGFGDPIYVELGSRDPSSVV